MYSQKLRKITEAPVYQNAQFYHLTPRLTNNNLNIFSFEIYATSSRFHRVSFFLVFISRISFLYLEIKHLLNEAVA